MNRSKHPAPQPETCSAVAWDMQRRLMLFVRRSESESTPRHMTIHHSTARYLKPARQCGAVPPRAWRVLIERVASVRIPFSKP